jgi:HEAT repeat protein
MSRDPTTDTRTVPGNRLGVRTLLVLVATCGALLWAARVVWESQDPNRAAALALRSKDPERRQLAALDLGRDWGRVDDRSLAALIAVVNDPVPVVRVSALESLGAIIAGMQRDHASPEQIRPATAAVLRALNDPDARVRSQAAFAIATAFAGLRPLNSTPATGPPAPQKPPPIEPSEALAALVGAFQDEDPMIRNAALSAMAAIGRTTDVAAPPALLAALHDGSPEIRIAVASTLADFRRGVDPAVPVLLSLLDDADPSIQSSVQGALGRICPSADALPVLLDGLKRPSIEIRRHVVNVLSRMGRDAQGAVPVLLESLNRILAAERIEAELGPGGPRDTDARGDFLYANLESALGQIGPGSPQAAEIVRALAEAVQSKYPFRHSNAAMALVGFGPQAEPAIPALIAALENATRSSGGTADRYGIIHALAHLAPGTAKEDEALSALIAALESGDEYMISVVPPVLPRFGAKAAVALPTLRQLASDPRLNVSQTVAAYLPRIESLVVEPRDDP